MVQGSERNVSDLSRSKIDAMIDEWIIGSHAERNRAILRRRLFDGVTFDKLAEEFDMSTRQVKNIVYKSERRLFDHLDT